MSETPKDAKGIFLAAVDIQEPAERAAFLERSCGGDPALRQRVEDLLRAYGQPDGPLDKLAAALAPTQLGEPIREQVGATIGPYKLMEQIGEGGFGLVFVAEQQQPIRRKVAIKIIKPGMDTRDVIARFEAERQALALMDHPNIARVLDAGTTESGRPYFVMELVRGIPITDYCDQTQLTPRERLELFVPVCNAIQHAHTKGIIHRDVKPSNVLVTLHDGNPVVKVIDFGVAKALHQSLTDKTIYTRFAQMLGTPLYMSPEQAQMSGLDIDTRTDVYSLGVLLYELLTGTTPFDKRRIAQAAYDELLKIIREEEPPKPSLRLSQSGDSLPSIAAQRKTEPAKLSKIFHGDLDWITMKALEKDRTRRYETANGFAADVLRYLNDEPVEASPPSTTYRLRKFAKKNRGPVIVGAVVMAILVVGIAGTTWGLFRAKAAEQAASESKKEVIEALGQVTKERDMKEEQRRNAEEAQRVAVAQRKRADEQSAKLTRQSYSMALQAAYRAIEAGELVVARALLRDAPESLRGWEWEYLLAEADVSLGRVSEPAGTYRARVPNGTYDLFEHEGAPNGQFSLMRSIDGAITDKITLPKLERILGVEISADANRIAFLGVNQSDQQHPLATTLYVWDRAQRKLIWIYPNDPSQTGDVLGFIGGSLSISANGKRVAVWGMIQSYPRTNPTQESISKLMKLRGEPFTRSNGCYVFDIDEGHTRRRVLASGGGQLFLPGGGQLNEDGSFLVTSSPETKYVDMASIATTDKPVGKEQEVQEIKLVGKSGVVAVQRGQQWELFDLKRRTSIRPLSVPPETSGSVFYAGGELEVGLRQHQLAYSITRKDGATFSLGHVPATIDSLYVDEPSRSVFGFGPGIYRYPLLNAGQIRLLAELPLDSWMFLENNRLVVMRKSDDPCVLRDVDSTAAVGLPVLASATFAIGRDGTIYSLTKDYKRIEVYDCRTAAALPPIELRGADFARFPMSPHPRPPFGGLILDALQSRIVIWGRVANRQFQFWTFDRQSGQLLGQFSLNANNATPIYCTPQRLWLVSETRIKSYDLATGEQVPLPADLTMSSGQGWRSASVSWQGDRVATVSGNWVTVSSFPDLRQISSWQVTHGGNSGLFWGQNDQRLFVSNQTATSICHVELGQVLLTLNGTASSIPKSGSAAILAGRICSSVPFKDRWAAIQAADAAESGPNAIERQASAIQASVIWLRNRLRQEGEKAFPKANQWINDIKQSLLIDASLTPVQKLVAVRLLAEIDAEARSLVDSRFSKLWLKTDVIKSLENDSSLSPETRAMAIELAKLRIVDWNALINQALPVLARGNATADEYRLVLRVAEAAVHSAPDNFTFVTALGCAQGRCGKFAESIATLTRSMEHASKQKAPWTLSAELVGLSRAHHELGHTAEAQAFRQRFVDWIKQNKMENNTDWSMLLKELDQHLATKPK